MRGFTVSDPSLRSKGQRSVTIPHSATMLRAVRTMGMVCVIIIMTVAGYLPALGQETRSRELERLVVEPPQRRAAPTRVPADDDSAPPPYDSLWDALRSPGEPGLGATSLIPPMSVVTDKSSVSSVGAAALPAQVDVVTRQDIERLDARTYTDLFRKVPGLRVFSYDAGEIGHPFAMRGFGGSHGSDVAVYVDGVPQNLPSSVIAMNGASDVSWLSPEMIDKIEIIKGPFSAFYGNQAQAGAVNFITKNSDPSPSLTLSGASFGGFRALPIISTDAFAPTPFLAYDFSTLDGYRDNSFYRRSSLFNKVTYPLYGGNASLRFNYYQSFFGVPGMLRIVDIKSGQRSRKSTWEESDQGSQFTWSFVFNYAPTESDAGLYVDAYVENTLRERFQTWWTYGQTWSHEDRVFYGGRIYYNLLFGNVASVALGAETRYDTGEEMEWDAVKREPQAPQNNHRVSLSNTSLFAQGQVKLADMLKIVGGVRKDFFRNVIDNRLTPENSGTWYLDTFNPKLGFVLTPLKNVNIFGNKGVGFRAPGATDMSPSSGEKAVDIAVAKTETWDLGFNATILGKFFVSADWYQTDMEKELRNINGQAVNLGDSQRNGYELEARVYASPQVNFFANYAWVEAKLKNPTTPGQTLVTAIPEHLIKGGMGFNYDLTCTTKFLGDIYCEYVGEQPFYSGSDTTPLYSPDYVVYNFKAAMNGPHWGLFAAAKYQPKEFSSNNWLGLMGGRFAITPQPLWDCSGGVKYTF